MHQTDWKIIIGTNKFALMTHFSILQNQFSSFFVFLLLFLVIRVAIAIERQQRFNQNEAERENLLKLLSQKSGNLILPIFILLDVK